MDIQNKTLWSLPSQPLPSTEVVGPVFVTIWLFITLSFTGILFWLWNRAKRSQGLGTVLIGTGLLSFWYLVATVDRWIHYDHSSVPFGYILVAPIWEFFYVGSANLLLWGTFSVLWKEFEHGERFVRNQMLIWELVANFAIFIVAMLSLFYVILYLALAIVWMEFFSLNTIADVATKRNGFEISMTAFFFGFSLFTAAAATYVIVWRIGRADKNSRKTRLPLWVATVFLFARSTSQFALVLRAHGPNITRQDTLLTRDVTHGLLTTFYLVAISYFSWSVSGLDRVDKGGTDAELVRKDIRKYILDKLRDDTQGGQPSPGFGTVLDFVWTNIDDVFTRGPLSTALDMTRNSKLQVARDYIKVLRKKYGDLDPREGKTFDSVRSTPASLLETARRSGSALLAQGRRTVSNSRLAPVGET